MPEGYSSLGGQVLLPSDTDKTPAGSSGGSAAATAAGLAALTIGMETSTDTAQLIAPAGVAGVVGLKPTRRARQPHRRPAGRQVAGLARPDRPHGLRRRDWRSSAIAGPDPSDPATAGAPTGAGLHCRASRRPRLQGKRIAVISSATAPYPAVVSALQAAGATTVVKTIPTPSPNPASIVSTEFKRDLNVYLSHPDASRSQAPSARCRSRTSSTTTSPTRSRGSSTSRASCSPRRRSTSPTRRPRRPTRRTSPPARPRTRR